MVFREKSKYFDYGEPVELEKLSFLIMKNFLKFYWNTLKFSETNDPEIVLKKISNKVVKDNLGLKKNDENSQIPKIEDDIDSKKEGSSKYSFYGSADDFVSEAISCFRIIGIL